MSNKIKIKILDEGVPSLAGGYVDLLNFQPQRFVIGDEAGFEPTSSESMVRGNVTYVGFKGNIKFKSMDSGKSLKIMLTLPEDVDDVDIGNVLLYTYYKGEVKPAVMLVLSEIITKSNPTSDITDRHYKFPGNRLVINITINYVNVDSITADYSVTVLTPNFANLPYIGTDLEVPLPAENPHSQFVVNEMRSLGNIPTFVTKNSDNTAYFAAPLFQNVAISKFGVLNGFDSDTMGDSRVIHIWGQLYTTPDHGFDGIIGGLLYTDDVTDAVIIGGEPY